MVGTRTQDVPRQREHTAARGRHVRAEDLRDPGGRTDIANGVVEKVAARAVDEVAGARSAARGRAVRARVSGDVVLLSLRIRVDYPEPVRRIAALVRSRVRERVEHTTGKQVHHIDIEIVETVR
ncbi:Asp23/Gls24 family envelope stress response protein [Nocardiopsis sp. CC223A]|uniref:Asp23/Gls24 family envelope stress response protein n=1 Tax=Nocardiopsis sp. CC223A TaxID=3044051 RepID=UPI00278BD6DE|nr:Asp23/Gls24 family envelope stress response protein [Nocardiopsis sp. CC223A]